MPPRTCVKSHGLGNDYLVVDDATFLPLPGPVRLLCDRNRGVGADGVLVPVPSGRAPYGVRIFNPDGSEAEKSGNGLRILARYLVDHRGAPASFDVEVGGGLVRCAVDPQGVTVDMGCATFEPARIPFGGDQAVGFPHPAAPGRQAVAVALGNPHCVLFVDEDLDSLPWREWGARVERHPLFPRRVNAQFARVRSPGRVEARIWERGAGETQASGSSACAIAAAGVRSGRLAPQVTVCMPGGELQVEVGPDYALRLRGPVEEVATVHLSRAFQDRLQAAEDDVGGAGLDP